MIIKCASFDVETTFQLVKDGKKKKYDPSPFNQKNYLTAAGVLRFDLDWSTERKEILAVLADTSILVKADARTTKDVGALLQKVQLVLGHFIKFDLLWFKCCGIAVNRPIYDTGIAEFVLARGQRVPLDLDSVAQRYGFPGKEEEVSQMIKDGISTSEIPWGKLSKYLAIDLERAMQVFIEQVKRNKLDVQQLAHL